MNPVAEEIRSYIGAEDNSPTLAHYGMPRRSGRYPWGSGEDPYQHGRDFLGRVEEMRKAGFTYTDEKGKTWKGDTAIAKSMGLSSTQFRAEIGIATDARRSLQVSRAKALQAKGLGNTAIGREMGVSESTVRSLLDPLAESRMKASRDAANFIRNRINETGKFVDVGVGVERELNISSEKLEQALYILKKEGYPEYNFRVDQANNAGQMTTVKVVCPSGTKYKDVYNNLDNITSLKEYISRDGGATFEKKFYYPTSIDSKRVKVLLHDEIGPDGEPGVAKDGLIQIRRGVPDLSLGESRYSQVRILVDGNKYLKGMAVYSDNMPDGYDIVFNSNKKTVEAAYKEIKDDPDNPFGSLIKDADKGGQYWYDPKTGQHVTANTPGAKLGAINKRADEGDWSDWKDAVPSQFLSKQTKALAERQLNIAKNDKKAEFDDYCQLNNPTIKKHLLSKFADECESAAVHLQGAALPGQKYNVLIPINSLKENEVYAPGYEDGSKLALVRYPHGGTFEIPIVTVNNKHKQSIGILGKDIGDAIGVNKKVAEQLSGADFDGDTVMCIPTHNGKIKIKATDPLEGLIGFDPTAEYGPDTYAGRKVTLMTKPNLQKQMGVVSNLITDMTLAGASQDELAAATRHSMVVIDSYKHKLDYKQSEIDNNIAALHKRYQGKETGGAATIISKAKGQQTVDKRQGSPRVNTKLLANGKPNPDYDPSKPEGSLVWKKTDDLYYPARSWDKETGIVTVKTNVPRQSIKYDSNNPEERDYYEPVQRTDAKGKVYFTNKDGSITYKTMTRHQKSTKMAEADDAYSLVSPAKHQMELVYADYANYMKDLARQARIEVNNTGKIAYSAQAKRTYEEEVQSLENKLNEALLNAPRERLAQIKTSATVKAKTSSNPDMDKKDVKKAGQQALTRFRDEINVVSRSDRSIKITDREWAAIQAGAISESKLIKILANTDVDALRQRATPKTYTTITPAKASRIQSMRASGKTLSEIAKTLGVSTSTVSEYLKGGN